MHASKADLTPTVFGEYEGRTVDWDSMRFAFESMPEHFPPDQSPFLGLPDDRCQCPHWGYVIKGSFRVTYLDGPDEIVSAGEVYYLRPGHFVQIDRARRADRAQPGPRARRHPGRDHPQHGGRDVMTRVARGAVRGRGADVASDRR